MEITEADGAVFMYTLAAVFTGIIVIDNLGLQGRIQILAVSGILAVLWTAYFNYAIVKRFRDDDRRNSETPS